MNNPFGTEPEVTRRWDELGLGEKVRQGLFPFSSERVGLNFVSIDYSPLQLL